MTKIPRVDREDISAYNLYLNGGKCFLEHDLNQPDPEYSQLSYLRLRSLEEVYGIFNYLDPKLNPRYNAFLQAN